ncbi:MAG TPA: alkaline phosphatase family protein, partial [Tepidisphaeraceae bacterium]
MSKRSQKSKNAAVKEKQRQHAKIVEAVEARCFLSAVPTPDHVVIVVEENHSYDEVIGNSQAPYINGLANAGAAFTNSVAVDHPSQPNYLAFFSGSEQGISDDNLTPKFSGANLASSLIAAGKTFGGYSQGLPSTGSLVETSGAYARKHNPWSDFTNVPTSANMPFTSFPSDFTKLPTVSFVVPDINNDMHDGSVNTGDTWLKNNIGAYATWAQSHNSLLIVTWDEDDGSQSNQVPTIFYGSMVKPGTYSEPIDHYSVLRTV